MGESKKGDLVNVIRTYENRSDYTQSLYTEQLSLSVFTRPVTLLQMTENI